MSKLRRLVLIAFAAGAVAAGVAVTGTATGTLAIPDCSVQAGC